ncbi:hypothetical protein C7446_0026 [Kushneria sinocarnis]|uniref:D-apionate lactonase N-terminal domain-containing protein n=1 Tax=Kushneria sinocarnis TaxID=595502 RepID=A0A420X035_9GAMM|nr:hypothetical protein [Kushneria sinocarnis]RKR07218.1 hypothetical protein C7446_0026 [Kushneria sinocarnis]
MRASEQRERVRAGTPLPDPPVQHCERLPLSFAWQAGGLRWLRDGGTELVRGVAPVIRDGEWGTHALRSSGRRQSHDRQRLALMETFRVVDEPAGRTLLTGRMAVTVTARQVSVALRLTARARFTTCRSGLVVLLPIAGMAGAPVEVRHADGPWHEGHMPRLISPAQPFFDIRSLRYAPPGHAGVQLDFEGDVFEMEDQRNWSDASFKIYNRPLAWPTPYTLAPGTRLEQRVTLTLAGAEEGAHDH